MSWDWVVRGWRGETLSTETVHRGDVSKDQEVKILEGRPEITSIDVHRRTAGDPSPLSDWERTEKRRTGRKHAR